MLPQALNGQAAFTSADTMSEHYWNTLYNAGYLRAQVKHYLRTHPYLRPVGTKHWTVISPDPQDYFSVWKLVMRLETVVGEELT